MDLGRFDQAESAYQRSYFMKEKVFSADHPEVTATIENLAVLEMRRNIWWPNALALQRRVTGALISRRSVNERSAADGEIKRARISFGLHVLAAHRVGGSQPQLLAESYEMAQWAGLSEAAAALAQMAARQTGKGDVLSSIIREEQDVQSQLASADARLVDALGHADLKLVEDVRRQITDLEARLKAINDHLGVEFKDYAEIAQPK